MATEDEEDRRLRAVAQKTGKSIVVARQRAQREVVAANEALELKSKELEQQREWFEVTLHSIGDAVITTDAAGKITFLNPVAEAMTGWTSAKATGEPIERVFRIINETDRQAIAKPLEEALETPKAAGIGNRKALINLDGGEIAIEDSVAPIRDAKGSICGAVIVFHDVTARRRAEMALLEETRILELLNTTGTAIAAQLDLRVLVQTVTDSATQLSGAKFGAFFHNVANQDGQSNVLFTLSGVPQEAFASLAMPRNTPLLNQTFPGKGVVRSADITRDPLYGALSPHHGMPKGHLPVRSYLAVPVISRSGEAIGGLLFGHPLADVFTQRTERLIVGIAAQAAIAIDNARLFEAAQREIASRERADATLRETDRRKDEFLATLAHELRNPLAPIRQATLISRTPAATEAQRRWSHDVIDRQVHHMALLLDDLLDISRITRGTLQLRVEMADLAAVVDTAIETARPAIDSKRHTLSIDLPSETVQFAADPLRVSQMLSNLLTNAAKYTDAGGKIRLEASFNADAIAITVADTGIGIPAADVARVFEMFSQVKTGQDRSDGGLGIGLALTKGLVELHGGTIEAKSSGTGRGSEFTLRLPRRKLQVPTHARMFDPPLAKDGGCRRVLIADDNEDAAESLAVLLRMEGHDVTVVHDGLRALATINNMRPEIALLDIGMPKLNGYEVARQIRQGNIGNNVTLVAVTGWGQDRDKALAFSAGFNHHFTKPVEPAHLLDLIRADSSAS